MDLKVGEKDTLVVDWDVKQFVGYLWDQWEESGEYVSTGKVDQAMRVSILIKKKMESWSKVQSGRRLGWLLR